MKVLITGVAGFIGSNLASRLLSDDTLSDLDIEVIGIDNLQYGLKENIPRDVKFFKIDIRNGKIHKLFKGADAVFHLAAKNCTSDCQKDPRETADINITGTINVFEAARWAGVRKIIYAESSALYEGSGLLPTPESAVQPKSFYAVSKLAGMHFAEVYKRYYGMTFTALRYFCVYGPIQDYRRTIPPVMSAFIIKLLKGERPVIYGTGEKRRDFVYVDDVNDFHLFCLRDSRTDHETYNLGSGENHSVLEIYDKVSRILGVRIEPEFKPDLPGEAQMTLADITKASALGWQPKTDIETGLIHAVHYIKSEMASGRI